MCQSRHLVDASARESELQVAPWSSSDGRSLRATT
jgi:hypothetical protein